MRLASGWTSNNRRKRCMQSCCECHRARRTVPFSTDESTVTSHQTNTLLRTVRKSHTVCVRCSYAAMTTHCRLANSLTGTNCNSRGIGMIISAWTGRQDARTVHPRCFSMCHCTTDCRGLANISFQCFISIGPLLAPSTSCPIGSLRPMRS